MTKLLLRATILTGLVFVMGSAAFATQVTLQNLQFGSAGYVNGTITDNGNSEYVSAGQCTFNGPVPVYCVDINHWSYLGSTYTYDREYHNDRLGYLINQTPKDSTHSAGLQLAVWELVNENQATSPYSASTGNFTASGFGDAQNLADQYLADSFGKHAAYFEYIHGSNGAQSFASPVPEPGGLLALLTGVSGLAGIVMRKRQ